MWKLRNFTVTQILREIKVNENRVSKSVFLPHLEALNFDFYEFLHFFMVEIVRLTKFKAPKMAKTAVFEFQDSPKLMPSKI